jgi:hypothetical protein
MDIGVKGWRQEVEAVEQRSLFRAPFSDVNHAVALAYPRAARSRYNAAARSTG